MSDDTQTKQIQYYYVRCEGCGYGFEHAELDEQNVCDSCRNGGDDDDDSGCSSFMATFDEEHKQLGRLTEQERVDYLLKDHIFQFENERLN